MTNDDEKNQRDQAADASAARPFNPDGGEDEASTSHDGKDDHLHEDQKPIPTAGSGADESVDNDDPHKTEKLTKAGRDIDPDEGSN